MSGRRSRGITLLELLVVLMLLGLSIALVAPSLSSPPREGEDAVQRVIDAARRAAIKRAEALTLSIESDGRWALSATAGVSGRSDLSGISLDTQELAAGTVAWARGAVRLHISPLGSCMLDLPQGASRSIAVDPARCRLRAE